MNPMDGNEFGSLVLDEMQFVSTRDFLTLKNDPAASLKKGELWRVFTPIFPHGNTLHLLFNVLAIIQLGQIVERMEGTLRFAIFVLITAVVSSLLQGLLPEKFFGYPFFGGLSGVVFGLFGFLLMKSNLRPELGVRLSQTSVIIMLGWMVAGFTGMMGPIANMAHLGGFLAGVVLAYWDAQQATASGRK
jgi:GlpG protein